MLLSLIPAQLRGKRAKKKGLDDLTGRSEASRPWQVEGGVELFAVTGEGCARNVRVPVGERTVGIVLPCPDVQRVKGRQTETIRCVKQMEQLSHQFRRCGVLCIPLVRDHQKVSADQ